MNPDGTVTSTWLRGTRLAGMCYLASTALVVSGLVAGTCFVEPQPDRFRMNAAPLGFGNWDGVYYRRIAQHGYWHEDGASSSVAFFPGFPLLVRAIRATGFVDVNGACVVVSQGALICAFILFSAYLTVTRPEGGRDLLPASLMALAVWPPTVFFHMAYTEGVFVTLLLLATYGMARNWHPALIAIVAGAASGTRATGVALMPVLFLYCLRRAPARSGRAIAGAAFTALLGGWGLLAYMTYLHVAFDNALAFAVAQERWQQRQCPPLLEHAGSLLALEPAWTVYVPSSPVFCWRFGSACRSLAGLDRANPLYFGLSALAVVYGHRRGILTADESLLCAMLLLIPYVGHSYRSGMMGHARYAAAAMPLYIIAGQVTLAMPAAVRRLCFGGAAVVLATYAALFAAGHRII